MSKGDLAGLGIGDLVVVYGSYGTSLRMIEHATANYLVVDGTKYRRKDGNQSARSGTWSWRAIRRGTPEEIESIRRQQDVRRMTNSVARYAERRDANPIVIEAMYKAMVHALAEIDVKEEGQS